MDDRDTYFLCLCQFRLRFREHHIVTIRSFGFLQCIVDSVLEMFIVQLKTVSKSETNDYGDIPRLCADLFILALLDSFLHRTQHFLDLLERANHAILDCIHIYQ